MDVMEDVRVRFMWRCVTLEVLICEYICRFLSTECRQNDLNLRYLSNLVSRNKWIISRTTRYNEVVNEWLDGRCKIAVFYLNKIIVLWAITEKRRSETVSDV